MGAERLPSPQATRAIAAPASEMSVQEREALAKELGYRQIGAELPDNVSLSNIIQSLPPEVHSTPPGQSGYMRDWVVGILQAFMGRHFAN